MLVRGIRLPQSAVRRCRCHRDSVAWFSTEDKSKKILQSSSSSSSSSSSPPSSSPSSSSSSIYDTLFRTKPAITKLRPPLSHPPPRSDHGKASPPVPRIDDDGREIDVSHVGDELKAWLESAEESTATQVAREKPESTLPGGKPVVVLSSLSRSLVASDFYRWAPQGRHVAGWAGGISKVVQAVSPVTREPRGQYFLFFDTWDAAHRCNDQLTRAYRLTNTKESPSQPKPSPARQAPTEPQNKVESASDEPPLPTTPLELRTEPQIMPSAALQDLINDAAAAEPAGPHRGLPTHASTVPYRLGAHLAQHGGPKNDLSWSVLVRLAGGKVTVDAMVRAIAADGAARNLPWRLVEPRAADDDAAESWPRPVQSLRAGSSRVGGAAAERQDPASMHPDLLQYGYTRFVVTFVDAVEGRRFARAWHRREMVDEWTNGVITVNTTALW